MPKVDWLWFLVGLVLGFVIHQAMTHPKSPISGIIGTKFPG